MDLNYNLYQLCFVESQMNMLSADFFFIYYETVSISLGQKKKICLHFRLVSRLQHVLNA